MIIYYDEAWRWPFAWDVFVWLTIIKNDKLNLKKLLEYFNKITKKNSIYYKLQKMSDLAKIKKEFFSQYLEYDDSKIFNIQKREQLYQQIKNNKKLITTTSFSSNKIIDKKWIIFAIKNAILKALRKLLNKNNEIKYSLKNLKKLIQKYEEIVLLIDWTNDFWISKKLWIKTINIVDWDHIINWIWISSIVAKYERDQKMIKYAKKFPQYWFEKHKWYWTKLHQECILKYWLCPIHRKTYCTKLFNKSSA